MKKRVECLRAKHIIEERPLKATLYKAREYKKYASVCTVKWMERFEALDYVKRYSVLFLADDSLGLERACVKIEQLQPPCCWAVRDSGKSAAKQTSHIKARLSFFWFPVLFQENQA